MKFQYLAIIPFLAVNSPLFAAHSQSASKNELPSGYLMCPKLSDLHKDPKKMTWFAKNGWLSYSTSFATHIDKFLGAQWQGVNVGKLTCLYASDNKMTFPIALEHNRLVYQPTGGKWGKNLGGYINCISHERKRCIFKPQAQPKTGDVYQEVRKIKDTHQQQIGF